MWCKVVISLSTLQLRDNWVPTSSSLLGKEEQKIWLCTYLCLYSGANSCLSKKKLSEEII